MAADSSLDNYFYYQIDRWQGSRQGQVTVPGDMEKRHVHVWFV